MRWSTALAAAAVTILLSACQPTAQVSNVGAIAPPASRSKASAAKGTSAARKTGTAGRVAKAVHPRKPATAKPHRLGGIPAATTSAGTPARTAAGTPPKAVHKAVPTSAAPPAPAATGSPRVYPNCAALNVDYPHGVGLPGAVDHVASGRPGVTDFTVDAALYHANPGRDGDHDGIGCEKH